MQPVCHRRETCTNWLIAGSFWRQTDFATSFGTPTTLPIARTRSHCCSAIGPFKIIAFGLSSFFAGVAGAMFAFQQQFITIDPPFNLTMSIEYIAIIVIGGMGTVFGAVACRCWSASS